MALVLAGPSVEARTGSLDAEFGAAAEEYEVPKELLMAMGYVNTRWEMPPPGASDHEEGEAGNPEARGSFGMLQLVQNDSRNTLGEAAELIGVPEDRLKTDREKNIRGGAAILAELQGASKPKDLNEWYDAVAEYGGGPLYAEQVYKVLAEGATSKVSTGERMKLEAQSGVGSRKRLATQSAGEYSGSTWYGASSYNYTRANRPSSDRIDKVIVHVTQGSWSGAINWFNDSRAQASAHYTVRSSDGFVGQSVAEKDIAWHAGNWSYNRTSIGIEHEGYVSDPRWFTDAMYRSSAKLTAYLCKKYGIPIDRSHIIGHNQVPYPNDHYDPGSGWDWNKYMGYVRYYSGDASTPGKHEQVIDNADPARFYAESNWSTSAYSSQRYSTSYRFTEPESTQNDAWFKTRIPTSGNYAVYGWWPADRGYNNRAVYWIYTSNGWVSKTVNQRKNGGKWVLLGTYAMKAGDDWYITVSNTSSGTGYIIADAIKVASLRSAPGE